MELFQKLGDEIETLWLEKNYNEEELPAIAAEALRRAGLPSKLTAWDVVEWSLKQRELPPQRDLHGNFADPPITIFSAAAFSHRSVFLVRGNNGDTSARLLRGFSGADGFEHP